MHLLTLVQQVPDGGRGLQAHLVRQRAAVGVGVHRDDPVAAQGAQCGPETDRGGGLADPALEAHHRDPVVTAGDRRARAPDQFPAALHAGRLAHPDQAAGGAVDRAPPARARRRPLALQQRLGGQAVGRLAPGAGVGIGAVLVVVQAGAGRRAGRAVRAGDRSARRTARRRAGRRVAGLGAFGCDRPPEGGCGGRSEGWGGGRPAQRRSGRLVLGRRGGRAQRPSGGRPERRGGRLVAGRPGGGRCAAQGRVTVPAQAPRVSGGGPVRPGSARAAPVAGDQPVTGLRWRRILVVVRVAVQEWPQPVPVAIVAGGRPVVREPVVPVIVVRRPAVLVRRGPGSQAWLAAGCRAATLPQAGRTRADRPMVGWPGRSSRTSAPGPRCPAAARPAAAAGRSRRTVATADRNRSARRRRPRRPGRTGCRSGRGRRYRNRAGPPARRSARRPAAAGRATPAAVTAARCRRTAGRARECPAGGPTKTDWVPAAGTARSRRPLHPRPRHHAHPAPRRQRLPRQQACRGHLSPQVEPPISAGGNIATRYEPGLVVTLNPVCYSGSLGHGPPLPQG